MREDGIADRVSSIRMASNTGLYNQQTIDGDIVVGGLVSSTYTEAVQFETAHSLLAPLRLIYRVCGVAPPNIEKYVVPESYKLEAVSAISLNSSDSARRYSMHA